MNKIHMELRGRRIHCENASCDDFMMCTKWANACHHLFSNDKKNRKIYGDLLDADFNVIYINNDCHLNRVIPKLTEIEFRAKAFDAGFDNLPMSKTMRFKKF